MAYIDRDDFYTPRQPYWRGDDGSNKNIGNTRLFFRKLIVGEDYEQLLDREDFNNLRDLLHRD